MSYDIYKVLLNHITELNFQTKSVKYKILKVNFMLTTVSSPLFKKTDIISLALRDKANKEIKRLRREGMIEDVTGKPTHWLKTSVIVPKGDNIRICVDIREGNKRITLTGYPTPTVKDLSVKLKGSAILTKLDLVSAFHQIELYEPSHYMTTFQSDTKIKRFTRLKSEGNSAAEELQNT